MVPAVLLSLKSIQNADVFSMKLQVFAFSLEMKTVQFLSFKKIFTKKILSFGIILLTVARSSVYSISFALYSEYP